jgi:hypothetical protein
MDAKDSLNSTKRIVTGLAFVVFPISCPTVFSSSGVNIEQSLHMALPPNLSLDVE